MKQVNRFTYNIKYLFICPSLFKNVNMTNIAILRCDELEFYAKLILYKNNRNTWVL